ncbi:MAG: heavy metal-binding domain-containing protein [Vicinamibacterales bacterium]
MRVLVLVVGLFALVPAFGVARGKQAPRTASQATNAFWCPMHPDVRSSTTGKCPICAMDLIAIPAATLGNYQLHVKQIARPGGAGAQGLHIDVRHPATSERVTAFSPLHERLLHLFIVRRDLSYFAHVHPDQAQDGFDVEVDLDPGAYVLIADFAPVGGPPQLLHRAIVTPGFRRSPFASPDLQPDIVEKNVDGLRVSLEAQVRLLKPSMLRFTLRDAATATPIDDVEPFLGAAGHLLIVNSDVTSVTHAHPETTDAAGRIGPEIAFAPTFATAGVYKMWVQFQRRGKVLTAPFAIDVK